MGHSAAVIPLHAAESDAYDADRLRVIPATKVETSVAQKRRASRERLFIPSTAWPEFAAVVAAGVSGRAVGLWMAIRMQARLESEEWVRVRTHLRQSLGFSNRAAHSRAVTELERAGLIEVQRRKGYAPLVRLVPQWTSEGSRPMASIAVLPRTFLHRTRWGTAIFGLLSRNVAGRHGLRS